MIAFIHTLSRPSPSWAAVLAIVGTLLIWHRAPVFTTAEARPKMGFRLARTEPTRRVTVYSVRAGRLVGEMGTRGEPGAMVDKVDPASRAQEAGLRVGDRLVSVSGVPVGNLEAARRMLKRIVPGWRVELEVVRDGESLPLVVPAS